jgi:predicted nucleotide-binding protein with TIR-like domain
MADTRKIFVGSSSEAVKVAELLAKVIKQAGMEPVVWNTIFPAGDILLENIEQLPSSVDGAVLVATPDVVCERRGEPFSAPVANVIFEYGYLAARLTRLRVSICRFEGAEMPSDLEGMTVVSAGNYEKDENGDPLPLTEDATRKLRSWLERLAPLADGIPPISRVHGYSGKWRVQNRFSRWRDIELGENDTVYFDGTAFLLISVDGEKGSGTHTGNLYVSVDDYRAEYKIANQILEAAVNEEGTLKMRVKVLSRVLTKEEGEPRDHRLRGPLPGSGEFDLELKRVPGESKRLHGTSEFRGALRINQKSEGDYQYLGF